MSWILEKMVLDEDVTFVPRSRGSAAAPARRHGELAVAAPWVGLLDGFREPKKIVDAVVEFSQERDLDPEATLDEVFPVFKRLLAAGLLVPAKPRGVPSSSGAARRMAASRALVDSEIRSSRDGATVTKHPSSSLTLGAAGVAYGLWHMARSSRDGALLDEAAARLRQAWKARGEERALYGPTLELGDRSLARVSPYHGMTGLYAVRALVSHARGESSARSEALAAFTEIAREPCEWLDLTRGQAGVLLGVSLLAELLGAESRPALIELGREKALRIRNRLARLAPVRDDRSVAYLGIAHGWGGLLYALLAWTKVSGHRLTPDVESRLAELAELGQRRGRGLRWRRVLGSEERPRYLPSWCNGAAGLVHLWILAHRVTGEGRYLDLAERCAWNAWEDGEGSMGQLCCGLSGRAYGLVAFHKATGEAAWLDRARRLAAAAMDAGQDPESPAHSLYKGRFGTAVLLADLEDPMSAFMPFFELMPHPPRVFSAGNQSQMVEKFR